MEHPEVKPTPVTNADELFAKMDMIIAAIPQLTDDEEGRELSGTLMRRVGELKRDIDIVQDMPEYWQPVEEKVSQIGQALRQKSISDLNAIYSM